MSDNPQTTKDEAAMLQLIDERDDAEQALSQAYYLVTGRSPEWSNLWGHKECLEEIEDACFILRQEAKKSVGLLQTLKIMLAPKPKQPIRVTFND